MNKYIEALNNHKEVVIVSRNENEQSAIFWKSSIGEYHSFNIEFSVLSRPDYSDDRFINHIETMQKENAYIFIRG